MTLTRKSFLKHLGLGAAAAALSSKGMTAAVRAFKTVIHDGTDPRQALLAQGLPLPPNG